MNSWIEQEWLLRLIPFIGVLVFMALWEIRAPKRPLNASKPQRWANNLGLMVLNSLLLRLVFPSAAVGVALLADAQQWGVFHHMRFFVDRPSLSLLFGIVLLDWLIWAQHRLFHRVPALWRLHRMHHADPDLDVTSGLRFHPLEILISMAIKAVAIVVLGLPVMAVLVFEILLNASAMFNHANVRLPYTLDKWLRLIIVTPDMHRVHHSWHLDEAHSNFGFNLPWWDRLFGTYRAQPKDGHQGMTIGLHQFRETRDLQLDRLLIQPFVR